MHSSPRRDRVRNVRDHSYAWNPPRRMRVKFRTAVTRSAGDLLDLLLPVQIVAAQSRRHPGRTSGRVAGSRSSPVGSPQQPTQLKFENTPSGLATPDVIRLSRAGRRCADEHLADHLGRVRETRIGTVADTTEHRRSPPDGRGCRRDEPTALRPRRSSLRRSRYGESYHWPCGSATGAGCERDLL